MTLTLESNDMVGTGRRPAARACSLGRTFAFPIAIAALLNGCAMTCLLTHGIPSEMEDFRDVKLGADSYEIILPNSDTLQCVQTGYPNFAERLIPNRARALCGNGFKLLVDGQLRPSAGPTEQEFVWRVECLDSGTTGIPHGSSHPLSRRINFAADLALIGPREKRSTIPTGALAELENRNGAGS